MVTYKPLKNKIFTTFSCIQSHYWDENNILMDWSTCKKNPPKTQHGTAKANGNYSTLSVKQQKHVSLAPPERPETMRLQYIKNTKRPVGIESGFHLHPNSLHVCKALDCYHRITPNSISFLTVLAHCSYFKMVIAITWYWHWQPVLN